jgi:hypothetical protein
MEKTITKQTKSGLSYLAFENPGEIKVSDIGKTVMVAGKKELFIIYKVHSEGTPGFKTGGVECVIGMSGVSKYCYFLDQVKLYDGRDLTTTNKLKSTKGNKNKTT